MKTPLIVLCFGLVLMEAGCDGSRATSPSVNALPGVIRRAESAWASATNPRTSKSSPEDMSDFQARCQAPGAVRCFGFDSQAETSPYLVLPAWDNTKEHERVVADVKASGAGSLRFEVPSHSDANTSGAFAINFADDGSVQFGEGEEFYVQWRQRFSRDFLDTKYKSDGWKQIIISEGDRPGLTARSCTQLEIVVQNVYMQGMPLMYHSCGGKDGKYEPLYTQDRTASIFVQNGVGCRYPDYPSPPCVRYKPDQWVTFQVHVKIGSWYANDGKYRHNSTVQLWVAEEGRPSKLVIDFSPESGHGYDLANDNPAAKYGKVWLLPYQSKKDPAQGHPVGYTWYDELIISRSKIPDPKPRRAASTVVNANCISPAKVYDGLRSVPRPDPAHVLKSHETCLTNLGVGKVRRQNRPVM